MLVREEMTDDSTQKLEYCDEFSSTNIFKDVKQENSVCFRALFVR
jgi:hypothetical protein